MRANVLKRGLLRVTRAEDNFYNRPLPDMTAFLLEVNRAEVEPHAGSFSLKTVLQGRERYDFSGRSVWVRPGQTLLVNAGERYASAIEEPCRSLSIFFRDVDVASAARTLTADLGDLLELPHEDGEAPEVAQIVLDAEQEMKNSLSGIVAMLTRSSPAAAEDAARQALMAALEQSLKTAPPAALRQIARRSTRDELLTRVLRARSAIHDRRGLGCTLEGLAEIACLSKYHFLRVFSDAFGETPLAMARRVRLDAARAAVQRGEPVWLAARQAGFGDLVAFRRALRRHSGNRD